MNSLTNYKQLVAHAIARGLIHEALATVAPKDKTALSSAAAYRARRDKFHAMGLTCDGKKRTRRPRGSLGISLKLLGSAEYMKQWRAMRKMRLLRKGTV